MPRQKKKPRPEGGIEKPEDKSWKEWFEGLDAKEHKGYLSKLGLDKEDIEEWEEVEGFKKKGKDEKK